MFFLIIILYVIVIFFESKSLFKEKNTGKFLLYSSLIILSMIINILLSLGVTLPSPSNLIKNIVISVFGNTN